MKRFLLFIILVSGLTVAAYNFNPAARAYLDTLILRFAPSDEPAPDTGTATEAPASRVPGPTPFISKLESPVPEAPHEKQFAPPGVFYVLERSSVETKTGIQAIVPGDQVKLMQRLPGGRMRVTIGTADFEVKETQVTNDLDLAREAEKREFVTRGGKL